MHEHGSNHLQLQTIRFCNYWEYRSVMLAAQDSLHPLLVGNFLDRRIGNNFSYNWLAHFFLSAKRLDVRRSSRWLIRPSNPLKRHPSFRKRTSRFFILVWETINWFNATAFFMGSIAWSEHSICHCATHLDWYGGVHCFRQLWPDWWRWWA